ncbi:MAG TPA: 4Fe-4S binding protein [Candidatus Limnocylindrales bacterium]|nr:4Fe-4S binding protein [Candidatus Limnocylindrales bacterium]
MGKNKFSLNVFDERCKECGICFEFCPKKNLKPGVTGSPELIDPDACTGCQECEYMCPDFAIQVLINDENKERMLGKEKSG